MTSAKTKPTKRCQICVPADPDLLNRLRREKRDTRITIQRIVARRLRLSYEVLETLATSA